MKMKIKITVLAVIVVALLVAFVAYLNPTPMSFKAQAIRTFVQEDGENVDMTVNLKFEGAIYDKLLFGDTFAGDMSIDDTIFYQVEFRLGKEALLFGELEGGDPVFIGDINVDETFEKVAIISRELDEEGQPQGNAIIIAGPALNRDEAIEVTKELLSITGGENIELFE